MSFAWSRTTYAKWKGMYFNFEAKVDRDYFVAHLEGAETIPATEAYEHKLMNCIRVPASQTLTTSKVKKDRQKRVRKWKKGFE